MSDGSFAKLNFYWVTRDKKIDWNQNHLNKLQNIESKSGPLPGRKVFVCSEHIELQI